MPKQIRFTQLVKAAGRPHPATLWVADPAKDPEFKKAIDDNRLVTVHHANAGAKTESGEIGFVKGGAASYLIFPKALPMAPGARVIGLKFDMLDEPEVKDPVKIKEAAAKPKTERVKTIVEKTPPPKKEEPEEKESRKSELARDPEPKPKPEPRPARAKPEKHKPKPAPKTREPSKFKVTVEFTAAATREIEVEAKSAAEAIDEALKQARKSLPPADWDLDAQDVRKY
jgi:hypothetical protein